MATVKADAHFVDCDRATGAGGSWESTQSSTVEFIGAVNNAGNMKFWDENYELSSNKGTSGSNNYGVAISDEYVAFGQQWNSADDAGIKLYDYSGTYVKSLLIGSGYRDPTPYAAWVSLGVFFSSNFEYVVAFYVYNTDLSYGRLICWKVSDGSNAWVATAAPVSGKGGMCADNNYLYCTVQDYGIDWPTWANYDKSFVIDITDGSVVGEPTVIFPSSTLSYTYDWTTNPSTSKIYKCGYSREFTSADSIAYANVWGTGNLSAKLDDSPSGSSKALFQIIYVASSNLLYTVGARRAVGGTFGTIFALDPDDLSVVYSADTGDTLTGLTLSGDGTKVLALEFDSGTTGHITQFDLDLTNITEYAEGNWTNWAQVWNNEVRAYPDLYTIGAVANSASMTQYRSVAYPTDWAHLEGQTVQVLKDGNYIGDDVVTGGQITLDD